MMYLIDTHALLWFLYDSDELSESAKELICTTEVVYVSIASLWKIAIKQSIGKLGNDEPIEKIAEICREKDIRILSISVDELDAIKVLPDIHRDPFDRLLIAQAMTRGLTIITKDSKIAQYNCVDTVW